MTSARACLAALLLASLAPAAPGPKKKAPLKAPRPTPAAPVHPGRVAGEVANTDVIGNTISVRCADKTTREYRVSETTRVVRQIKGKPETVPFEDIAVGEPVELFSTDGKTAREIRARAR
ncbi:MAG: hypothetical protein AAB036_01495 [Elusimicrobiota bacterium]